MWFARPGNKAAKLDTHASNVTAKFSLAADHLRFSDCSDGAAFGGAAVNCTADDVCRLAVGCMQPRLQQLSATSLLAFWMSETLMGLHSGVGTFACGCRSSTRLVQHIAAAAALASWCTEATAGLYLGKLRCRATAADRGASSQILSKQQLLPGNSAVGRPSAQEVAGGSEPRSQQW